MMLCLFRHMCSKVTLHNLDNSANLDNSPTDNGVSVASLQVKVKTTESLYCIDYMNVIHEETRSCEVVPSCPSVTFDLEDARARFIY